MPVPTLTAAPHESNRALTRFTGDVAADLLPAASGRMALVNRFSPPTREFAIRVEAGTRIACWRVIKSVIRSPVETFGVTEEPPQRERDDHQQFRNGHSPSEG